MEKVFKVWTKYSAVFIEGIQGTLWISAVVLLFGSLVGLLVAVIRMTKFKPIRWIGDLYVEILRGTPILLQLYFFWLGLPKLLPAMELSETQCILVALVVNESAYISEIFRAGISAVDKGQFEAARSLGLTEKNVMLRVVLPQAVKNILPALGNEFISTLKGTSLASVFFVNELMTAQKTVQSATYLAIEPLIIAGIIYLVMSYVLSKLLDLFERRLKESD